MHNIFNVLENKLVGNRHPKSKMGAQVDEEN